MENKQKESKQAVLLFSGGTDSTAAAILLSRDFDHLHLLTYTHSGSFAPEKSGINVAKLQKRFSNRFSHLILNTDRLFKKLTYLDYARMVKRFGVLTLSTCGMCKLAMHVRTLLYCLDHGVKTVADGSNRNMSFFPAQMPEVCALIRGLYKTFGIEYTTPVFDFDCPDEQTDWIEKLSAESPGFELRKPDSAHQGLNTTSALLLREEFTDSKNYKSSQENKDSQARCFQLVLMNIMLHWYYLPRYGKDRYTRDINRMFEAKISRLEGLIRAYIADGKNSKLGGWIDG